MVIHQGWLGESTATWMEKQVDRGARLVVHTEPPKQTHENPFLEKYLNCSTARNTARLEALKLDCDQFMFLDSDVVPPINTLDHFLLCKNRVKGGWYPIKGQIQMNERIKGGRMRVRLVNRWVAGRWVGDSRFMNAFYPRRHKLWYSDMLPAGCCMMDREICEAIPFEPGIEVNYTDEGSGQPAILGECGIFGTRLAEQFQEYTWMVPGVICRHEDFRAAREVKQPEQKTVIA